MAKLPQRITNLLQDSTLEIAEQVHGRIQRSRGTMAVFIRPDGRVRILRDEMLEDDTGRGVAGHFNGRHSIEHIRSMLELFLAHNQAYLGQS